jgi:hypothetical protein
MPPMRALPLTGVPGKLTRRLAAMTLAGQAVAVFLGALVAWQLTVADGDPDRGQTYLVGGCVLAVLCLLVSGLMRRPFGVTLGWAVQLLTLASALVLPAMLVVAVIFGGLWVLALWQGPRAEELADRHAAEAAAQQGDDDEGEGV